MIESLLTDSVVYRSFRGDCAYYDAETKDYTLGNVMVREVFSSDDDFVRDGTNTVYFFRGVSSCTDADGQSADFPPFSPEDRCILHPGTADERVLRVAASKPYRGVTVPGYVRLTLK